MSVISGSSDMFNSEVVTLDPTKLPRFGNNKTYTNAYVVFYTPKDNRLTDGYYSLRRYSDQWRKVTDTPSTVRAEGWTSNYAIINHQRTNEEVDAQLVPN